MIHYVCKYSPIELFNGFGEECSVLDHMPENFDLSDRVVHPNLCGFGKSVIQSVLAGSVEELVLVNCCDTIRRVYDIIRKSGRCRFLYLLDLPHKNGCCQRERFARSIQDLRSKYSAFSGKTFDREAFASAFTSPEPTLGPYVGILGVRVGHELESMISEKMPFPVRNLTCTGNRDVLIDTDVLKGASDEKLFAQYASALLSQMPCRRMDDYEDRKRLYNDPNLRGCVYHTIKFCDYYGFEYSEIKGGLAVPVQKIETDYTKQSQSQLNTRLEAFTETISRKKGKQMKAIGKSSYKYVAGIDSGSTSTDVVVLDKNRNIVASRVVPTGGGADASAEKCLDEALRSAGIERSEVGHVVTTGYGREFIGSSDESITEITCHAKGAHFLNPAVRTVIDIGGQDSKVISLDESGKVKSFVMNDKCAAGTGRFLEMMARTLGLSLEEMSGLGLRWNKDIVISSMCTVFAESEVVSLVAQNKAVPDIIHGLNKSVAAKTAALAGRLKSEGEYMMTGGVAKNAGVVRELEEKLGEKLFICGQAQLCGALGAAIFALD